MKYIKVRKEVLEPLRPNERLVYLSLLISADKNNKVCTTILDISKDCWLTMGQVNNIINNLIDYQLISEDIGNARRFKKVFLVNN